MVIWSPSFSISLFLCILCLGEWTVPLPRDSTPVSMEEGDKKEPMEEDEPPEVKGDAVHAPIYVQRLLPVFTHVFQSSMIQSIR